MKEESINLRVPNSHISISDAMNPFLILFKDGKVDFGDITPYKKLVIAEFPNNEGMIFDDLGTGKDYEMIACVKQVKYKEIPKPLRKILKNFANPGLGEKEDSPSPLFRWIGLDGMKGFWMFGVGELPDSIKKGFSNL
jgi:hypothetical protein